MTFVTKAIQGFLQLSNKKIIAVATSAVAAQLFRGELAAHSNIKLPILCSEYDTCNVPAKSQLAANLQNAFSLFGTKLLCVFAASLTQSTA